MHFALFVIDIICSKKKIINIHDIDEELQKTNSIFNQIN